MKKAVLEQMMLGFILFTMLALFVATVYDEKSTRDRIYDLKTIAEEASTGLAKYYEDQIDMCTAESIIKDILNESPTGKYLLDNNLISFQWKNLKPDTNNDGVGDDNEPDTIVTTIAKHEHPTFWYKFFGLDSFDIGPFSETKELNTPKNVNIWYGGENAGYTNMVGTYQLDQNNCVVNTQLILANSDDNSKVGTKLGSTIQSPPTYIFLMPNGYQRFQAEGYTPNDSDVIDLSSHCFGANTQPDISIGNTSLGNDGRIYFEQTELNSDDYEHIQIIPNSIWDFYNDFVNGSGEFNGQGTQSYEAFMLYCEGVNADDDPNNDIDCIDDPNDEYQYAMEDLDNGGDEDFNDIFLNTTRIVIPNELNDFETDPYTGDIISLVCNDNNKPIISLENCPAHINEDTGFQITWTANDNDGDIITTDAAADNGSITTSGTPENGVIGYTPSSNYYGDDTITVQTTDNDNGSTFAYCTFNVVEVNDIPLISGTPDDTALIGQTYVFIPTASDVDGDTLTFSISDAPSWASFNTSTGALLGVPTNSDDGVYSNIVISVSDGRGGVASLNPFTITVPDNNSIPELISPILDQNVTENTTYTYNISTHFSDPDNDTLTYAIEQVAYANNINSSTGLISINIPDNTAGDTITLTVRATDPDGLYATDTFVITIDSNSECSIDATDNFSDDNHDWNGGSREYDAYKIDRDDTGYKVYDFGSGCKNTNVSISFRYFTTSWENSDDLNIYINNTYLTEFNQSDYYWTTKTINTTTNSSGILKLSINPNTNKNSEKVYIDDINITKQ